MRTPEQQARIDAAMASSKATTITWQPTANPFILTSGGSSPVFKHLDGCDCATCESTRRARAGQTPLDSYSICSSIPGATPAALRARGIR